MSDLGHLLLIGGLFSIAAFVVYFAGARVNYVGNAVITGCASGTPLTIEHRKWLLWMTWLPHWAGVVAFSIVFAAIFNWGASLAEDASVRRAAYLCAGAAGFSAFFWFVFAIPYVRFCLRVIRDAEQATDP